MVMTRAGTPTNPSASVRNSPRATHQQKRHRRTRTRLRLSNDTGGTDEVEVSSSVAVRTAGADDPDDAPDNNWVHELGDGRDARGGQREERDDAGRDGNARGRDDRDDEDSQSGRGSHGGRPAAARRVTRPIDGLVGGIDTGTTAFHDEKVSPSATGSKYSGWDAMPTPPPVVVQARNSKVKKLDIEDFEGLLGDSIEAWLSTVRQAVQRQEVLGGDTWTSAELYFGARAHLKGNANKWLVVMNEGMSEEDYTFEYLTSKLRKKYGRRENAWKIQKRLSQRKQQPGERLDIFVNSLTNIGFGKRVAMESYLEAFYDGMNNQDAAAHVCTMGPTTLSEALEYAVSAYGEYGAGRKVTCWQGAQRRYHVDSDDEEKPSAAPTKKSESKTGMSPTINWEQLGLGFGGRDTAPKYDDSGKPISGLAGSTAGRDSSLPLAALQAIAVAAGIGQATAARALTTRSESSKPKTAKTLEVEAESRVAERPPADQPGQQYQRRYDGGYGGGGRGADDFGGRGRGGYGRGGGRSHYGDMSSYRPQPDSQATLQRKAETTCHHCRQPGHWWRECQARISGQPAVPAPVQPQVPPQPAPQQTRQPENGSNAPTQSVTKAAGNGPGLGKARKKGSQSAQTDDVWTVCREGGETKVKSSGVNIARDETKGKSGSTDAVGDEIERKKDDVGQHRNQVLGLAARPVSGASEVATALPEESGTRVDTAASEHRVLGAEESGKEHKTSVLVTPIAQGNDSPNDATVRAAPAETVTERVPSKSVQQLPRLRAETPEVAVVEAATDVSSGQDEGGMDIRTNHQERVAEIAARVRTRCAQYAGRTGSLAEMRAVRRTAEKEAKKFRVQRRHYRLQQKRLLHDAAATATAAKKKARARKDKVKMRAGYDYVMHGSYGNVQVIDDREGKPLRKAQLRVTGSSGITSLPTALLAVAKNRTLEVRLDTGAQFSIAGDELRKYGRCLTRSAPVDIVEGFGGGQARVLGVWQFVGTTIYQQRVTVNALLVEGQGSELLIGEDWMTERHVKLDFGKRELKFHNDHDEGIIVPFKCHGVTPLLEAPGEWAATVRLTKTVKLVTNVRSIEHMAVNAPEGTTGLFLPKPATKRHLLVAPTVPTDETMTLLVMNRELERARVAEWVRNLKKEDRKPLSNEDSLDTGEMEPADRDLMIALLRQHADIIEKKEGCPPLAKAPVEHHINTGDAAPIMLRRRRHAVTENEIIDNNVDDMLKDGVIEEGSGAWGFPVVLVKKKDGTVRRFTSLDLHAGYWQLAVAQEDRPKTAFTTRRGLFRFCRMPFGLCNAPSTFQRLMDCVLRGLTWVCCLVYLDDVIIFSKGSVARHVVELAVVLERLSAAGLSLKASKCSFAAKKMEYRGHNLTPEGIQPTDRLVKAVVDFPRPTDTAEVRRSVALAGYYRRFMPSFGARMSPLTKLLRKPSEWQWGNEQEEAFRWAKAGLSRKPVLIYPGYRLPFKLTTDASKAGLGAVLSQDQGHGDQPVAYASKFVIVTDHVALKWLMTTKEPAGRLHRWALTLQEFDFEVVYRPGRENSVADALSRGPIGENVSEETERKTEEDEPSIRAENESATMGRTEPSGPQRRTMARMDAAVAMQTPRGWCAVAAVRAATGSVGKCEHGERSQPKIQRQEIKPTERLHVLEDEIDLAADDVVRAVTVRRVEAGELGIVQFTDEDIRREQDKSVMVQTLKQKGAYRGQSVITAEDGLVHVEIDGGGSRVILPAVYWALAFKEAHDSIWAGHLRGNRRSND
ncbi:unnamed protein product [Phytophthora fragariaefolia]|uniref:Unnamed protein product n=1 Tax=Phytophthora fragariaefolia TaxID=1490495 RepID=A0A9W7DBN3_9STRA|nr:unnamed protein product [Phytophthora fragariaefolia]